MAFVPGTARLQTSSYVALDSIADILRASPDVRVEIGAHTDSSGSSNDDLRITTLQAEAVRDYLVVKGVSYQQIVARGYGSSVPLTDGHDAARPRGQPARRDPPGFAAPDLRGTMEERRPRSSIIFSHNHLGPMRRSLRIAVLALRPAHCLSLRAAGRPGWGDELPPAPPLPDSLFAIPEVTLDLTPPAPPLSRPPSPVRAIYSTRGPSAAGGSTIW